MLNQLAEAKKEALASQEVKFVRPPHKIKDKVSLSPTGVSPQTLEQADKVLASRQRISVVGTRRPAEASRHL